MEITFLGATGTVTGSKYLITSGAKKILVDCGLFQGFKQLRLRNWEPFPVDPGEIEAVVLTHAHLDHSGYIPLLAREGFTGKVYCSRGTRDLCAILLPDSGHLQEEDAEYANRHKFSKHTPALPLYTREDAEHSLNLLSPVDFDQETDLGEGLHFRLLPAGHILGAALVSMTGVGASILFSGDLGRPKDLVIGAPTVVHNVDYLVVESTYGNRLHDPGDPKAALAAIINRTVDRGGIVLIPSFAVGRAQTVLYLIHLLKEARAIPDVPVYLNSPMAVEATGIYHDHIDEHRLTPEQCQQMCTVAHLVRSVEESRRLNELREPAILISASGMATGGRVLHHLKAFAPDPRNTILFVGFQAGGTRGEAMVNGAKSIKIHGDYVPVRAEVVAMENLSAHADYTEIMAWLEGFSAPPKETFITHGEPAAADALRHRIEEKLGWRCRVPDYREQAVLK
ncbi:MAG TPA: MBL fold metallo-hydrolase [Nitrospiria bacterium]|nr:MBL fold metallo-hydrolase [Nitrospiria bacterium]